MTDGATPATPAGDPTTAEVAAAYGRAAAAWARGPERVYGRLADVLLDTCPLPLRGARLIDLGAGTGVVSHSALRRGAVVVAVDISRAMLDHDRQHRPPSLVADLCDLPLPDDDVDIAVAAFAISHVTDPARALGEARRVTRPGGAVLASVFAAAPPHPSKAQVDAVAERYGFRRPAWYDALKGSAEPLTADPAALHAVAAAAGLRAIVVTATEVDVGVADAESLVDYRLGMAHLAPFVASLEPPVAGRLREEALDAIGPHPLPLRPAVLLLASRVPP